jgi:hypothetical protein
MKPDKYINEIETASEEVVDEDEKIAAGGH